MKKIKKAILPVAGFGTRFLPATKAQPKEMLPIVDKPAIQYLVEDAVKAGIEEVIFVTGRGKRAIEDHFDYCFELDYNLVEKNKIELAEKVKQISNLAKFSYVRQPMPLGDGHAINCASHLLSEDEAVLVIYGDCLYDAVSSHAEQMVKAYEKYGVPIIGLAEVELKEVDKFGIIDGVDLGDGIYEVKNVVEKPKESETPSRLAVVGIYVITPEVVRVLKENPSTVGEIRLAEAFARMVKDGKTVYGKLLEGEWLDIGNKLNFIKTTLKLGVKDEEIKDDLREFIKKMAEKF